MLPGNLPGLSIKLCHTTATALTSTFADNYTGNTPALVYSRSQEYLNPPANNWFGFTFDKPFEYDGRQNIIVEVTWVGAGYAAAATWWGSGAKQHCYSYVLNGNPVFGYPTAGLVDDHLHYMRITLTPDAVGSSSLGRVKGVFR